jgi:hypothetical protein
MSRADRDTRCALDVRYEQAFVLTRLTVNFRSDALPDVLPVRRILYKGPPHAAPVQLQYQPWAIRLLCS